VSAVVTTPAVVDALIDEAIYALQGRGVFCGLTGGVIMLSIWPCTQACALAIAFSGIHPMTMASVRSAYGIKVSA